MSELPDNDRRLEDAIEQGELASVDQESPELAEQWAAHQKVESLFAQLRGFSAEAEEEAEEEETPLPSQIGRYQVQQLLGQGTFGNVYQGYDAELERTVAIKVPRQSMVAESSDDQFLREARATAQLNHPNIVSVHEVAREADQTYIVSDFVDGLSMDQWRKDDPLNAEEAAQLCLVITGAIAHAHEQGVVHRDLKPANIMMDKQAKPYVMDFGLAKRQSTDATMTMEGKILGTPAYMSPEQARGENQGVDARSDVYALGVILFELLTGERPFRGSTQMLLNQVIHDDAPDPKKLNSKVPRDLSTICLKCLEKSPEKRYQAVSAFGEDLSNYLEKRPIMARPLGRVGRGVRWCRRRPLVAGLSAAVVVVLLAGTSVSLYYGIEANREKALAVAAEKKAKQEKVLAIAAEKKAKQSEAEAEAKRQEAEDARQAAVESEAKAKASAEEAESRRQKSGKEMQAALSGIQRAAKLQEWMEVSEKLLRIKKDELGVDHNQTIEETRRLAQIYLQMGYAQKAIPLLESVIEWNRERHGEDDKLVIAVTAVLGMAYDAANQPKKAIVVMEESFRKVKEKLGEDSAYTRSQAHALGWLYCKNGQPGKGLMLLEREYLQTRDALGKDDPNTLEKMENVGWAYLQNRDLEQAKVVLGECYRLQEKMPDSWQIYQTKSLLGEVFFRDKQYAKAEPLLIEGHQGLSARFNTIPMEYRYRIRETLQLLVTFYNERGKPSEAAKWKSVLDELYAAKDLILASQELANTYQTFGQPEKQAQVLESILVRLRRTFGPANTLTSTTTAQLAVAYIQMGQKAKAIPLLEKAVKHNQAHFGEDDMISMQMIQLLVSLYKELGKPEEAAKWQKTLDELQKPAANSGLVLSHHLASAGIFLYREKPEVFLDSAFALL